MAHLSRWQTFAAAPHRVMFFGGIVQLVLAILWWGWELGARYLALWQPLSTPVPPVWAHAWLMLFGLFPFFMFGFLMTTYPRWMGGPEVPARRYLVSFLAQAAGLVLFYLGLAHGIEAMALGVLLHAAGLGYGAWALYAVYRQVGAGRDRRYEFHLNLALGFGLLAELAYAGWLLAGDPALLTAALSGALWLFLLPMLVLVAHRMIPYFTNCVVEGYTPVQAGWSFPVVWGAAALHFLLEVAAVRQWLFVADLPLLLLALHHSALWGMERTTRNRLLFSLHLAFLFLGFGLALSVAQSLWLLATGEPTLGRAPLHLLGIGFIGGMVVAMVTRVSRGHSGRPLVMDGRDWYAFVGILAAAVVRAAAELQVLAGLPLNLNLVATLLWLLALLPWAARYLPIYLLPRVDGKAG